MDIVERYCEGEEAGTLIKEARDEIARLRSENESLASNLRGKHATTGATYAHLIAERDRLRDENAKLRDALSFYADETRYRGPNISLTESDKWSELVGLQAYRLDVTRDGGVIATKALAAMQKGE